MFAMMLMFAKCELISQLVLGKSARAVPHEDGSGPVDPVLLISTGIAERGKNQIRIPSLRSSIAYTYRHVSMTNGSFRVWRHTPPPFALNDGPYV